MPRFRISGLVVDIAVPDWMIHDNLKTFMCTSEIVDLQCTVVFAQREKTPGYTNLVVKVAGSSIYFLKGCWISWYDGLDIPSHVNAFENWSSCTLYIHPCYNCPGDEYIRNSVKNGILSELRSIVIASLLRWRGLLIHSCSILHDGRSILFSAPSGTGKTTHANIWKELYGSRILDGDVTACRIIDGSPIAYGLPWCGSSGAYLNESAPLRAIVFLKQSKENRIERLDPLKAFIMLAARCYMHRWNESMTSQFLDIVQEIANKTACYFLHCLPDYDAARMVNACLEQN